MGHITLLISIGIVAFLLVIFTFKLDKEHFLLKLISIFFIIFMFFLCAKVANDDKDFCAWTVTNSTVSGAITSYEYDYQCSTNTKQTNTIFLRLTLGFFYLFLVYFVLFLFYNWFIKGSRFEKIFKKK